MESRFGLVVDELCGHQQVVVKSIEESYGSVPGIAGGDHPRERTGRVHPRRREAFRSRWPKTPPIGLAGHRQRR